MRALIVLMLAATAGGAAFTSSGALCQSSEQARQQALVPRGSELPSFDCAKARTAAARLICADGELALLDGDLGAAFQARKALLSVSEQKDFAAAQLAWIRERNAHCELIGKNDASIEVLTSSKPCMVSAIGERIAFLGQMQSAAASTSVPTPSVAATQSQNKAVDTATHVDRPTALDGPADNVQIALVTAWQALNEDCRGGPGDDPATKKACDRRRVMSDALDSQGCQYHEGDYWTCVRKREPEPSPLHPTQGAPAVVQAQPPSPVPSAPKPQALVPIEPNAVIYDEFKGNTELTDELATMVRMNDYRCDSISAVRPYLTVKGFKLVCNHFDYSYDIEDKGGHWVVKVE